MEEMTPEAFEASVEALKPAALALFDYWADNQQERPVKQPIVNGDKVGRNDPCPCGSGKKYKQCCLH